MNEKSSQTKKIVIPVTGMTCASCVSHVEKALKELTGVISVNVNLATEKAMVEYDAARVSVADFRRAVDGAGCAAARTEANDGCGVGQGSGPIGAGELHPPRNCPPCPLHQTVVY